MGPYHDAGQGYAIQHSTTGFFWHPTLCSLPNSRRGPPGGIQQGDWLDGSAFALTVRPREFLPRAVGGRVPFLQVASDDRQELVGKRIPSTINALIARDNPVKAENPVREITRVPLKYVALFKTGALDGSAIGKCPVRSDLDFCLENSKTVIDAEWI
jgi:hypothetical protein